jgi:hypothetical protein
MYLPPVHSMQVPVTYPERGLARKSITLQHLPPSQVFPPQYRSYLSISSHSEVCQKSILGHRRPASHPDLGASSSWCQSIHRLPHCSGLHIFEDQLANILTHLSGTYRPHSAATVFVNPITPAFAVA